MVWGVERAPLAFQTREVLLLEILFLHLLSAIQCRLRDKPADILTFGTHSELDILRVSWSRYFGDEHDSHSH